MTKFWALVNQNFLTNDFHAWKTRVSLVSTHPGLFICKKLAKIHIFEAQIQKYFVWCLLGPIPRFEDPFCY
jgi:hypothetical protein